MIEVPCREKQACVFEMILLPDQVAIQSSLSENLKMKLRKVVAGTL